MAINVGILGFAHGHVDRYCNQWRDHPEMGVAVVSGWDHDATRAEAAAARHGFIPCSTAEELLARNDVQAVVIATETSLHCDMVEKAAAAGKAIVVQKPLALTMKQADRIVNAVNKFAVPFTMAWQMRVDPQNIEMMRLIQNQTLGKVLSVRRRHALSTHTWKGFEDTWHNNPVFNRDIWADDSAHPIDWMNSLFGAPESITAEILTVLNPKVPHDNGIAIFRYPNGPLVEVCCSFTCTAAISTTEIICERGTIIENFGDGPSCSIPRSDADIGLKWYSVDSGTWIVSQTPSPTDQGARISGLAAPLADFLNGRRGPICTAEDARVSLRMVLATYVSSMDGRRVNFQDKAIDLL